MVKKGLQKDYVWEVSWRLNKDCNILTPSSSGYSSTSFSSCGAAQPEGPASVGTWFLLLEQQQLTPNSDLQLTRTSCSIGFDTHLLQWASHLHSIQPVHSHSYPLISSTECICYLHRCISYLTARPGRRSICYNINRRKKTTLWIFQATNWWQGHERRAPRKKMSLFE